MASYMSIGEVARITGCNVETIRYYEREGVMPSPRRSPGGHRLYSQGLVERLNFIRRSRELGFSMEEIHELLRIVDREQVSCEKVKDIARSHIADISRKIDDLQRIKETLADLSRQCSGEDVPECPIIESLWPRMEDDGERTVP